MPNSSDAAQPTAHRWQTFEEILCRLHQERILIHPHQLAEFFVCHGLPVDLRYVPARLKERAKQINDNYLGDMVRLEIVPEQSYLLPFE